MEAPIKFTVLLGAVLVAGFTTSNAVAQSDGERRCVTISAVYPDGMQTRESCAFEPTEDGSIRIVRFGDDGMTTEVVTFGS